MEPLRILRGYLSWFILGLVVLIVVAFLWSWVNSPLLVTVTGIGEVSVPATKASLTLNVVSADADAAIALSGTRVRIEALRGVLKGAGVVESDLFESQVTIVPNTVTSSNSSAYLGSISLGAQNIPANKISTLILALYASGATYVSQPVVSSDNPDSLSAQALDKALQDANKQAAAIARKNWKFIKKVAGITQSSSPTSTVTSRADTGQPATPNASGVYKVSQVVSVTYQMW